MSKHTDRELLELAAKAAGMDAEVHEELGLGLEGLWLKGARTVDNNKYWNPLTNDGDALRLAVKLGFAVDTKVPGVLQFEDQDPGVFTCVIVGSRKSNEGHRYHGLHEGDPLAATRRAIVRAAASLATESQP